MHSKTKIIVLRMKELIYTGIFVALGILLIILLIAMFRPGKEDSGQDSSIGNTGNTAAEQDATQTAGQNLIQSDSFYKIQSSMQNISQLPSGDIYIPGIYTTQLILNDQTIEIEVIVDQSTITSLRISNISEAVTTMYPLLQPTFDDICEQIYEQQSVENITYDSDSKYTSLVLLEAIKSSLNKAQGNQ